MIRVFNYLLALILISTYFIAYTVDTVQAADYPIELTDMRTENSNTYYLGKVGKLNRYALNISKSPMYYKNNYTDESEAWKQIDLTPVNGQVTKAPYDLTINGNLITVRDKKTGSITSLNLFDVGGKSIPNSAYVFSKGKATATNIAIDTDLEITWGNSQINFSRILKSDKAPLTAKFSISKVGSGIQINVRASDNKPGIKSDIPVTAVFDGSVFTETIDTSKVTLNYPVKIDPTLEFRTTASSDDCMVYYTGAAWAIAALNFIDIQTGWYDTNIEQAAGGGMRFLNVTVPAGSTIDTATLILNCRFASATATVNSRITGEDVDDAATFSTLADYQARRGTVVGGANDNYITTATVDWDNLAAWIVSDNYTSPEIKTVIQEIVSRPGWASGNDMVLFWDDHADRSTHALNRLRYARSYDSLATSSPVLHIEYTAAAAPTVVTNAATLVEETTATTNGNCTAMGGADNITIWGTQYGTTGSYGSWANNTGVQAAPFTWSDNLTSLTEGEYYYFRAFAQSYNGFGSGAETHFMTKPDEPAPFTCTAINNTAITISWTAGAGADYTYVRYEDGSYPTDRTDGILACNTTLTTVDIGGLTPGHYYYSRGWSWASENDLNQYSDAYGQCFTQTVAPPTVVTRACTGFTGSSGIVNGVVSAAGTTPTTQYGFDYGLTTAYGSEWLSAGGISPGINFWANLTGLTGGTVYHYRAKAFNGTWGYGSDMMFNTQGSPVTYEYLNTGCDGDSIATHSSNMTYQQFTIGSISHTVTSVKLDLKRVGNPGTVRAGIYHATAAGVPTGSELCYGTYNGDIITTTYQWVQFNMNVETNLQGSQPYAIVLSAPDGDNANYVMWCIDSGGGLGDAVYGYSTNGGVTYTADAPKDALFEVWGNPCIQVLDAKIFTGYQETDDWLICAEVQNTYVPYYPNGDPSVSFQLQLIDDTTVKATSRALEWGRRPLAIYINAATAGTMTWGGATIKVRLVSLAAPDTVYAEYALTADDWNSGGLTYLDQWVKQIAADIASYHSLDLLTQIASKGLVLTQAGGQMFGDAIVALQQIRPNLFQITYDTATFTAKTYTDTLSASHVWSDMVGTYWTEQLTDLAAPMGLGGKDFIAVACYAVWLIVGIIFLSKNQGTAGILCGLPIIFIGWYIGAIDFIALFIVGVICLVAISYALYQKYA